MDPRRRYALLSVLLVAVLAGGAAAVAWPRRGAAPALRAVPADAWLVASVDVAALRRSALGAALFGGSSTNVVASIAPGLGSVVGLCGFDPVARLRELVVAAPEAGDRGEFGVAFSGDFSADELAICAETIIRGRGGRPARSARGSFSVVEDTSAAGSANRSRVACRQGGLCLVGQGAWLDAMMDAARSKTDALRPEHAGLRAALSASSPSALSPGGSPPLLLVTSVLPRALREALKAELALEPRAGPWRDREGAGLDLGGAVLAVESAGIAVAADDAREVTDVTAELRLESPAASEALRGAIERERATLSVDAGVRAAGLGPLLDSLVVQVRGSSLSATARIPTGAIARLGAPPTGPLTPPAAAPLPGASSRTGLGGAPPSP